MKNTLLFDTTALLAGKQKEWQNFTQIGDCYLPQVVYDEMSFLGDRSPEPEQETIARAFIRFFPDSGWQITLVNKPHPSLQESEGASLSKASRLQKAIAEAAYGFALENPESLVILVSNRQALRQQVEQLEQGNLTTITNTNLLQWVRTKQRPISVTQKMQNFNVEINATTPPISASSSTSKPPAPTQTSTPVKSFKGVKQRSVSKPSLLSHLISLLLILGTITVLVVVLWSWLQPTSFQKMWQKTGFPTLPWVK